MNPNRPFTRYLILFIPWLLSILAADFPVLSYLLAWTGSFFIFYISLSGRISPLPADRPFAAQLMRPIILIQLVFAGYMCCTSIFYFYGLLQDQDTFSSIFSPASESALELTARCQRYYCLGHAAFTSGLLVFSRSKLNPCYSCSTVSPAKLIFNFSLFSAALCYLLNDFKGLSQFSHQLHTLSVMSGTLALALSISERRTWLIALCVFLYGLNLYHALLSGFKEPVILSVLVLGIFLYPHFPRIVCFSILPCLFILFMLLPTYNRIFREQAWSAGLSTTKAGQIALATVVEAGISGTHKAFFTHRLSEVHMFTLYISSTPARIDYYGFDLLQQALASIIPRAIWPSKPITEELVMERVRLAGAVHPESEVSAKPAFIADAYLSGGLPGIFCCLFGYGALCQLISNKAERLFGGYLPGTALIFCGLFQFFWRGQCFEFLFNSVFWSYVSMQLIFLILRFTHILKPNENITA